MNYEIGKQPCANFNPEDDHYYGGRNVHSCYKCYGRVSFCKSCCFDHHENGYESCDPQNKTKEQADER